MKLFNEGVELNKKNICEYLNSQKHLVEKLKIETNIKKTRPYLETWVIEKEMNKFLNINQKLNYIKTRVVYKANQEQKIQNKKRRWRVE